jgi:hypothetical protein
LLDGELVRTIDRGGWGGWSLATKVSYQDRTVVQREFRHLVRDEVFAAE